MTKTMNIVKRLILTVCLAFSLGAVVAPAMGAVSAHSPGQHMPLLGDGQETHGKG